MKTIKIVFDRVPQNAEILCQMANNWPGVMVKGWHYDMLDLIVASSVNLEALEQALREAADARASVDVRRC